MVNVSWTTDWFDKSLRPYTPAPLSVLAFPVYFHLNAYWLIPRFLRGRKSYRYFLIAFLVITLPEVLRGLIVSLPVSQSERYLNAFVQEILSRDSLLFMSPSPALFAFLLSTAYRFTVDWMVNERKIQKLETEKVSMELSLLKSQINPHFLFNSLNALDDLIEKDQKLAKKYLHTLAKMYRFIIKNTDQDLVRLSEEWHFIDNYVFLIKERFGSAYLFEKTNRIGDLNRYVVPPSSLQSLLENAIKHNEGSLETPLMIAIDATPDGISVSHVKRPKRTEISSLGTGLKNLRARYKLLSHKDVVVQEDEDRFTVILPLIQQLPWSEN